MTDIAAICDNCESATTSIYDGYICADCRIEALEREIEAISAELAETSKQAEEFKRWYHEESDKASERLEYVYAFRKLVEEISKGRR